MSQESPNKLLNFNTIKKENEKGGIDVSVMEEKLGTKEDVPVYGGQKEKIEEKTLRLEEQKIKEFEDNYNSIFKEFLDKIEREISSVQNQGTIRDTKTLPLKNYSPNNLNDQKLFLGLCKNKYPDNYKLLKGKIDELDGLVEKMKNEKD